MLNAGGELCLKSKEGTISESKPLDFMKIVPGKRSLLLSG
jgi:hypothetical protein